MNSNKGRALVTGGAGLIGSHLVDLLIETGYEVTILDNLEPGTHRPGKPAWLNPKARFIQGDIRNDSDLKQALQGARFIFHQAAYVGFTDEATKYMDVNVGGTAKMFEVISNGGFPVEKIVVASSQAVYGEGAYECQEDGQQFPAARSIAQMQARQWELLCPTCGRALKSCLTLEDKIKFAQSSYALSKEFEEKLALSLGKKQGIPVVALRYSVTYGPRQSLFNPYTGIVSIFSTRLLNNLSPLVYEDGQQTRDFIYVGDVAKANLFVLENKETNYQVFNVATGRATSVADLAVTLASIYGKKTQPQIPGQFRWGDVRHILPDPSKLNRLGFFASTSLGDGLLRFAEWIKGHGPVEEYFTDAQENLKKKRIVYG